MHPELKHAIDTGASIPEIIELFAKYHSGSIEDIDRNLASTNPSDISFWDNRIPSILMGPKFSPSSRWSQLVPIQDPSLHIYKGLTREIIWWLCDSKRKSNVYMIAELGRIAISRQVLSTTRIHTRRKVISGICCHARRSRAAPGFNVCAVSNELAACYPAYRRILTGLLIDYPGILELPTRTCFKKLILEPWKALQQSHPQYVAAPPVIVLHWDPRYGDKELFSSICEFMSPQLSLLWILTMDAQQKLPIREFLDPAVPVPYLRLPLCYDEAPADAALVLRHRFSELRRHVWYKKLFDRDKVGHVDEVWPSDEQISQLSRIVLGAFAIIDAIIDFVVRRVNSGGLEARLETFLAYMVDSPLPSDDRPYSALDHFYAQAFSSIPPHLLPVANQVLSFVYFKSDFQGVSALETACLFSIGTDILLAVHPYLSGWVITGNKQFFRANDLFGVFLRDPMRSGQFYSLEFDLSLLETFLHFLSRSSNLIEFMKSRVESVPIDPNTYIELEGLTDTVISKILHIPYMAARQQLLERLLYFDFRCLAHHSSTIDVPRFMSLLQGLYELGKINTPNIVRVEPVAPLDREFIDRCEGLAKPWDIHGWPRGPNYVLLGFEHETVLVLLEDCGSLYRGRSDLRLNIYTSAMLDFM